MVESFNISVAAALVMWAAAEQRRQRRGSHADLTAEEQQVSCDSWPVRFVRLVSHYGMQTSRPRRSR
jgi:hypothetical protein